MGEEGDSLPPTPPLGKEGVFSSEEEEKEEEEEVGDATADLMLYTGDGEEAVAEEALEAMV